VANRIDNAIDKLETALNTLVVANGSGTLRAVVRRLLNVLDEPAWPIASILPTGSRRTGGPGSPQGWVTTVPIRLVTRVGKPADADAAITELVGKVQGAIDTLAQAGTAGAAIDLPSWSYIYVPTNSAVIVAAYGEIRVQTQGAIAV